MTVFHTGDVPVKKYRCPKCRKVDTTVLQEVWNGRTREFQVLGGVREAKGESHYEGHCIGVTAFCNCGWEWKLRKVKSINCTNASVEGQNAGHTN